MSESTIVPEPARRGSILYVGQDQAGHWLVQENHGLLEGHFISRDAAWRYAKGEVHAFSGARIVFTSDCMEPGISFEPAPAAVPLLDRAA